MANKPNPAVQARRASLLRWLHAQPGPVRLQFIKERCAAVENCSKSAIYKDLRALISRERVTAERILTHRVNVIYRAVPIRR